MNEIYLDLKQLIVIDLLYKNINIYNLIKLLLIIQIKFLNIKYVYYRVSSKGFRHGSHEWIINIQKIGVIEANKVDEIGVIDDGGIKLTNKCGYGATAKPTIPTINPTPSPTLEPTTPAPTRIGTKN
eukprot:138991_1